MSQYVGASGNDLIAHTTNRYLYALRRTDAGDIFINKVDQISIDDSIQLNEPGDPRDNYTDFEVGVDFFEGRDVKHEQVFPNLRYEQYRWDDRNLYYYINDEGELVVRINQRYDYPEGI